VPLHEPTGRAPSLHPSGNSCNSCNSWTIHIRQAIASWRTLFRAIRAIRGQFTPVRQFVQFVQFVDNSRPSGNCLVANVVSCNCLRANVVSWTNTRRMSITPGQLYNPSNDADSKI
jgi:hypothetical protein